MKRSVRTVLLGLAGPAVRAQRGNPAEDPQALKNEIQSLDQQVNPAAVSGNLKVLGKIMSDDYIGVAPNGMILRKPIVAAHYQSGTLHYESVVNSDVEIHLMETPLY